MPSTTMLLAGEVMDRSAALLNDPAKTDYTYVAQLPYLNMAIDELVENLEESNSSPTNQTALPITVAVGINSINRTESLVPPYYPDDMVEIQELGERLAGSNDSFVQMTRKEFLSRFPPNNSLLVWSWENQSIKFNPNGAITPREIEIKYIARLVRPAIDETTYLGTINVRSYLSFKTAALCAMFIGENETRAQVLEDQANKALDRITGINNKGRQQIMTRHRPFRASYKRRGY